MLKRENKYGVCTRPKLVVRSLVGRRRDGRRRREKQREKGKEGEGNTSRRQRRRGQLTTACRRARAEREKLRVHLLVCLF